MCLVTVLSALPDQAPARKEKTACTAWRSRARWLLAGSTRTQTLITRPRWMSPGALLGTQSFPTTRSGYRRLLGWLREFGEIQAIAVESTGPYAAALVRFLREHDITAVEVNQPHESSRLRWCNGWGARRRKMRCTGWRDVAVKVAGPPHRTALVGARGCSHAAGHSIRRYRPWLTVCDAPRAWRLLGA
jgi:hypothetical protein